MTTCTLLPSHWKHLGVGVVHHLFKASNAETKALGLCITPAIISEPEHEKTAHIRRHPIGVVYASTHKRQHTYDEDTQPA